MSDIKNKVLNAFMFRYACKAFDPDKKISHEDFEYILEAGRLSPSSFGWEPWKFVVVQDTKIREKLKEYAWGAKRQLPTSSHFVLLMARKAGGIQTDSEYLKHMVSNVQKLSEKTQKIKLEYFDNFKQNDFDLTDDRKLFDWTSKQVYIALGNMMTAAAMIGIDSCPMEGFDRDMMESVLSEEGIVDINEFGLSAMVAFGYRAKDAKIRAKTRREIDEVVKWV